MSEIVCTNTECTIEETGTCVLDYQPDECPNRVSKKDVAGSDDTDMLDSTLVLPAPENIPRLPPSNALGIGDVFRLMRREYCHLIGLLGMPESGKTACIVSLYLRLAHSDLDGFNFADSRSLLALDELSRGARSWSESMPEQMTAHTKLEDGRSPGFMHLKLRRQLDGTPLHLLIPDLPGEWTKALIDKNRTDRWSFLRAVDAVWIMVDGRTLADRTQLRGAIHRTNLLLERVAEFLNPDVPPVHIVVTRLDLSVPADDTLRQLRDNARRCKVDLSINNIASFSNDPATMPGTGLAELVQDTVTVSVSRGGFWPSSSEGSFRSAERPKGTASGIL